MQATYEVRFWGPDQCVSGVVGGSDVTLETFCADDLVRDVMGMYAISAVLAVRCTICFEGRRPVDVVLFGVVLLQDGFCYQWRGIYEQV